MQVVIIQARMGSKRLPGKVLLKIGKLPLLLWVIYSAKVTFPNADLYVASSLDEIDDSIEKICKRYKISIYRGSLNNVYSRFTEIIEKKKEYTTVIRFTADNPLKKIFFSRLLLFIFNLLSLDYIGMSNLSYNLPEIISVKAFKKSLSFKLTKYEKEHVTPIFYKERLFKKILIPKIFLYLFIFSKGLTIDTKSQYKLAKTILLKKTKYYKNLCSYFGVKS